MAEKKVYESEYVQWCNEQAALLSEIDGVRYDYLNPEQIEKRLLSGEQPAPAAVKQPAPKAQPVTKEEPKVKHSNLGWIVAGFDI